MDRWDEDDARIFGFLAVFLSVVGIVIALIGKKNDSYVMYYIKQSTALFIFMAIIKIFSFTFTFLPALFENVIYYSAWILVVIIWVVGSLFALSGEMRPFPLIGRYADSLRF